MKFSNGVTDMQMGGQCALLKVNASKTFEVCFSLRSPFEESLELEVKKKKKERKNQCFVENIAPNCSRLRLL